MKKFTLLELLIVIAIIGILSSLLLPSLSKSRLKAQQIVCLNNQRQLHLATTMYAGDNNSYVPIDSGERRWFHALNGNYLPEVHKSLFIPVLICPNGNKARGYNKSYQAINDYLREDTPVPLIRASGDETLLLIDSYSWWSASTARLMTDRFLIENAEKKIIRHLEGANVTFIDGHGAFKRYAFFTTKNDRTDTFWDPQK